MCSDLLQTEESVPSTKTRLRKLKSELYCLAYDDTRSITSFQRKQHVSYIYARVRLFKKRTQFHHQEAGDDLKAYIQRYDIRNSKNATESSSSISFDGAQFDKLETE